MIPTLIILGLIAGCVLNARHRLLLGALTIVLGFTWGAFIWLEHSLPHAAGAVLLGSLNALVGVGLGCLVRAIVQRGLSHIADGT